MTVSEVGTVKKVVVKRRRRPVPVVLLVGFGLLFFLVGMYVLNRGDAPRPQQQNIQQITLVQQPPPPPPPPPPPEKVVQPEAVLKPAEEAQVQENVEEVNDSPTPPSPSPLAGGLNRSADIGSDSFGLAAGKGGGLFGRGAGGGGSWDAFVATHIRRALLKDERTRVASGYLEVALSIDAKGRFERAELQSSTGDSELDAAIRDVLRSLPPLSRGRPANIRPLMITGLNLRAAGS